MNDLSSVRDLQPLEQPAPSSQITTGIGRSLHAKVSQRDLVIVVAFSLIGLLLTLAVMVKVPDAPPPAAGVITLVP
jgi:hypothetical protein